MQVHACCSPVSFRRDGHLQQRGMLTQPTMLYSTLLSVPKKNTGSSEQSCDKTEYIYFTFVILKMRGYETPLACY